MRHALTKLPQVRSYALPSTTNRGPALCFCGLGTRRTILCRATYGMDGAEICHGDVLLGGIEERQQAEIASGTEYNGGHYAAGRLLHDAASVS